MSNIIILAAIILYLGMVVWIGVICSKKNSDVGDFYLGGRKLGPVVTAMHLVHTLTGLLLPRR